MRVSFIGMSNIGKTYWARRLAAEKGLRHIDCDALIEAKLGDEFAQAGYRGLHDVAKWMGQPPAPQYEENSRRYRVCEQAVLQESVAELRADPAFPAVIDTTGSMIYADAPVLAALRAATRVVYFEASPAHVEDMFKRYIAHPKPTIWGDVYAPQPGETPKQTLRRCYPELLRARALRYSEIAHVTIPFDRHRDSEASIGALIKEIGLP